MTTICQSSGATSRCVRLMSWFGLGTVMSRGARLPDRSPDGARPIRTGRSTSAVEPSEARSTARIGPGTNCGAWLASGLPHTRQLVELGGLACPCWHSTSQDRRVLSSSQPAMVWRWDRQRRHLRQHPISVRRQRRRTGCCGAATSGWASDSGSSNGEDISSSVGVLQGCNLLEPTVQPSGRSAQPRLLPREQPRPDAGWCAGSADGAATTSGSGSVGNPGPGAPADVGSP